MSSNLDTLASDALALPPEQRMVLAQLLWESVEGQVDDNAELFANAAKLKLHPVP